MVWFPISHNCLLTSQVHSAADSVPAEEVNLLSVENSCEFFVASQKTSREEEYQEHLGLRASGLNQEDLLQLNKGIKEIKDYLGSLGGTLTTDG